MFHPYSIFCKHVATLGFKQVFLSRAHRSSVLQLIHIFDLIFQVVDTALPEYKNSSLYCAQNVNYTVVVQSVMLLHCPVGRHFKRDIFLKSEGKGL